jgi:hypothetical protein
MPLYSRAICIMPRASDVAKYLCDKAGIVASLFESSLDVQKHFLFRAQVPQNKNAPAKIRRRVLHRIDPIQLHQLSPNRELSTSQEMSDNDRPCSATMF